MWLALRFWAANRLLMKGWEISGQQTLGMCNVTDVSSYLIDTIPAPRVLQNRLDLNLELYIAKTELQLLKALQNAMLQTRPHAWIVVFTATVITLHARVRDIWRLEHWVLNPNVVSRFIRSYLVNCHSQGSSPTNGDTRTRRPHLYRGVCISAIYYSTILDFLERFLKILPTLQKRLRPETKQVLATSGQMKAP